MLPKLLGYLTVQVSDVSRSGVFPRLATVSRSTSSDLSVTEGLGRRLHAGEEVYSFAILFREEGLESDVHLCDRHRSGRAQEAESGVYELERIKLFTENHRRSGGQSSLSDYYTAA